MAFVGFAVVGTVSPGPNNAVLWASGMRFGFGRTLPHVLGTAIGMAVLVLGVAAGIGALLDAVPAAEVVLKVVGSVYLLWVAVLVLGSGGIGAGDVSDPFSAPPRGHVPVAESEGVGLLDRGGRHVPAAGAPPAAGAALLTAILMVIVVGTSSVWAAGGAALGRFVDDDRTRAASMNIVLALLLVASVALHLDLNAR